MGEKYLTINEMNIHYIDEGEGPNMLLLHGWGQNTVMMREIQETFSSAFRVINIDFPGFGKSDPPKEAWSVSDYEKFLKNFLQLLNIQKVIIVAHSFGGRVAIKLASDSPELVDKLILTGAAGIRAKVNLKAKIRTYFYKLGKFYLQKSGQLAKLERYQNSRGSADYKAAKGIMKPTLVKVVNEDLLPLLPHIVCDTLLVWGELDQAVPLWMGEKMAKLIPHATLIVFAKQDHFAYWHEAKRFNNVIQSFLGGNK